jgi:hypothetical protein
LFDTTGDVQRWVCGVDKYSNLLSFILEGWRDKRDKKTERIARKVRITN